jgi:hypothetical protein
MQGVGNPGIAARLLQGDVAEAAGHSGCDVQPRSVLADGHCSGAIWWEVIVDLQNEDVRHQVLCGRAGLQCLTAM